MMYSDGLQSTKEAQVLAFLAFSKLQGVIAHRHRQEYEWFSYIISMEINVQRRKLHATCKIKLTESSVLLISERKHLFQTFRESAFCQVTSSHSNDANYLTNNYLNYMYIMSTAEYFE